MITGKLSKNLNLLNKQKLNDFEKFINSPYFLKRKQLPALFSEIKKHIPNYDITKEKLFCSAFPGKVYNDTLMRKYLSELNHMLETYFAVSGFMDDYFGYTGKLVENNISLKNYDEAEKLSVEALRKLEKCRTRNENYYFNKFIFEKHIKTVSNKRSNLNPDSDWMPTMDSFINYSAITVLRFYNMILNDKIFRKGISGTNLDMINDMVKVFRPNVIANNPVARIQYCLIRSNSEPENVEHYYSIKDLLMKHQELMDEEDVAAIYTYLHNYCFIRIDNGNLNFLNERFDIINQVLAKGYYVNDGVMIPDMFISMAVNALMLNRTEWAEEFIKKYKDYLPVNQKQSVLDLAYATLYMFKKDYDKALGYLSRVKFKGYYDKFKIKSLNLMIYYESGMYEAAFSLADSFRHFISKYKSITPYVKERTVNFINQILQLIKYRLFEADEPEISNFKAKTVMMRGWLFQKIEEARELRKL